MLNKVFIMGRLTRDPELKYTPQGTAVTRFTLACERNYGKKGEKEVDFINCIAWRNMAENVAQYFTKGRMAVVTGSLQIRKWEGRDGIKREAAEVNTNEIYFGDSKKNNQQQAVPESDWDSLGEEINVNAEPTYPDDLPF